MSRSLSRPSQVYPAGDYGPFTIDNFTNANTDYALLSFTIEGWPVATPLITGELTWQVNGADAAGSGFIINSPYLHRDGTPYTVAAIPFPVPLFGGNAAKDKVTALVCTFHANLALQTAVTLQAMQNAAQGAKLK